jgi:hypothetical protein
MSSPSCWTGCAARYDRGRMPRAIHRMLTDHDAALAETWAAAPQLHPHMAKSRSSRDYTPVPGSRSSVDGSAIMADGGS